MQQCAKCRRESEVLVKVQIWGRLHSDQLWCDETGTIERRPKG